MDSSAPAETMPIAPTRPLALPRAATIVPRRGAASRTPLATSSRTAFDMVS